MYIFTCCLTNSNTRFTTKMYELVDSKEQEGEEQHGTIVHHDFCVVIKERHTINHINQKCDQQQNTGQY